MSTCSNLSFPIIPQSASMFPESMIPSMFTFVRQAVPSYQTSETPEEYHMHPPLV